MGLLLNTTPVLTATLPLLTLWQLDQTSQGLSSGQPPDLGNHSRISWCPTLGFWVALYKFGDYAYDQSLISNNLK